jgi:UPF0176 protein
MTNSDVFRIAAFYHFGEVPAARVDDLAEKLESLGIQQGLKGLIIFATEGINGTICGETSEQVVTYLGEVSNILGFPLIQPKWSEAPTAPFRKFKIRVRTEIVTLGKPEVQPLEPKSSTHLSPDEWDQAMQEEGVLVLDTRNWYETRIGKFKQAVDPKIEEFQEFGSFLDKAEVDKEKKILIYCTGGIRCEKAIVEMHNKGFKKVYQLDGGILNYLAEKPNRNFEGECFVFDHRVAVDQALQPTQVFKMCPHCGQPADQTIQCLRCDLEAIVCVECIKVDVSRTCSKNCAHHYTRSPGKKGRSQSQGFRYKVAERLRRPANRSPQK